MALEFPVSLVDLAGPELLEDLSVRGIPEDLLVQLDLSVLQAIPGLDLDQGQADMGREGTD